MEARVLSSPSSSSSKEIDATPQKQRTSSSMESSVIRLWRPAAQRNLRNQWSKLASCRQQWASSSSNGRSQATSLVNAYLSRRYMPAMELGVLGDIPDIRQRACGKLFKQQELYQCKLLSSYKNMVDIVNQMVNASRLMRCYLKGTSGNAIVQFSSFSGDENDSGDGGGIPVFIFLSVSDFERLAEELVQMYIWELNLKRLLVVELLSVSSKAPKANHLRWSDELYPGEFHALSVCNLYSLETRELQHPRLSGPEVKMPTGCNNQPSEEVLQVYLTTWLTEVNIDTHRANEICEIVGEEMRVKLS